jgi:hypothetical protein
MKRVELKPFNFEHLDLFAWRDDDLKTYGIRSELMDALTAAAERGDCWTAIYDGRILVVGGIIPQTQKTGLCFTIFSEYADQCKIGAARTVKRMLASVMGELGLHRITTYNRADAQDQHKWCEWLGFKFECVAAKFDDDGNNYFQYAFTK